MAQKTAISNEYVINVTETGNIEVYRNFDNVKSSLRKISVQKGFTYDPQWTTRQFGKKLIDAFGDGDHVQIGNYFVKRLASGTIESYRTYDNVKGALREVAEKVGFHYAPEWTTRQFGNKLVDFLNSVPAAEAVSNNESEPISNYKEESVQESKPEPVVESETISDVKASVKDIKKGGCLGLLLLLLPVSLMCYLQGEIIM